MQGGKDCGWVDPWLGMPPWSLKLLPGQARLSVSHERTIDNILGRLPPLINCVGKGSAWAQVSTLFKEFTDFKHLQPLLTFPSNITTLPGLVLVSENLY